MVLTAELAELGYFNRTHAMIARVSNDYSREEIIEWIRHISAQDGGKPVGYTRLANLTGITRRSWSGVYWASWADALREAGLEPNSLNQRRDDDDLLLDAVALVRHFRKLPSEDEWRLASRNDPTLPRRTALRAFGGRKGIVIKLRELAESDSTYADLLDLLPAASTDDETPGDDIPAVPLRLSVAGYVYLMKAGKHYKIGHTTDVDRRKSQLGTMLPEPPNIVHKLETDDPAGIERYWHKRFRDKNVRGELFALSREDVAAFKRRGRFM